MYKGSSHMVRLKKGKVMGIAEQLSVRPSAVPSHDG